MAKFCSNCGKELDEKADICLNCGVLVNKENRNNSSNINNGKKKGLPTWAIVLIIVGSIILIPIIILILFSIFVFNIVREEGNDYIEDARDYFNEYVEDYETISEGAVGDTLKIDGIKLTLNDVIRYENIQNSTFKNTPSDGNEYLVFFFDVENTNNTDKLVTYLNFEGYLDENKLIPKFIFGQINDISNLNKTLSPNEKVKGYVVFEVDKEWTDFTVYYGGLLSKEKIAFYVINDDSEVM